MRQPRLVTERLSLRRWRPDDAKVLHALWRERDPRVPPHRRLDEHGQPVVATLAERIAADETGSMFAIDLAAAAGTTIGCCGLVPSDDDQAPSLAYELLQAWWGQGLGSEAARAVIAYAQTIGCRRLQAWVWDWNVGSRRLLEQAGFDVVRRSAASGAENLLYARRLDATQ